MDNHKTETLDIYCPGCNVQVEAIVVAEHTRAIPHQTGILTDPVDTPLDVTVFSLAKCRRCEQVFLTKMDYYEIPGEVSAPQTDLITLYPTVRSFDESLLPTTVATAYKNASGSYQAGLYEPCVVMSRKCLEAICHENGITNGNLRTRLERLHQNGVIDDKLLIWANGLRLVGNEAAHEMDVVVDKNDAKDSLEFVEALFLYVFSLDKRFQEFQQRRDAAKASRAGDNSGN